MRLRTLKSRKLRSGTPSFEDFMTVKNLKRCIKSRIRASVKNHGKMVMSSDDPKASWKFIKTATFTQPKELTTYLILKWLITILLILLEHVQLLL